MFQGLLSEPIITGARPRSGKFLLVSRPLTLSCKVFAVSRARGCRCMKCANSGVRSGQRPLSRVQSKDTETRVHLWQVHPERSCRPRDAHTEQPCAVGAFLVSDCPSVVSGLHGRLPPERVPPMTDKTYAKRVRSGGSGRCGGARLGTGLGVHRPGRQSDQRGHEQDPELQPGHGVPPAGQDRSDGLGRGPWRALETG